MKVIVAEDEVLVRLMLADVLREHGFEGGRVRRPVTLPLNRLTQAS